MVMQATLPLETPERCMVCERPASGRLAACAACRSALEGSRTPAAQERAIEEVQERLTAILIRAGDRSTCRSCNREIFWIHHRGGRAAAYERSGRLHLSACPRIDREGVS